MVSVRVQALLRMDVPQLHCVVIRPASQQLTKNAIPRNRQDGTAVAARL